MVGATGTRAFTRSRGVDWIPGAHAPSCEPCCAPGRRTASCRTPSSGTPPARWRRAPLYATRGPFGDRHTETIGPPLLPFARELVADSSPDDPAFCGEALPQLAAHLRWLEHHRDPDDDGLLTIVVPDESGLDDSPKYEPVFGRLTHDRVGYALLMERGRRARWDSHALIARHDHHVDDVWVNVAFALSLDAMARLSGDAGWAAKARRVEQALLARCLDASTGLFFDLAGRFERPVRVSTWSALSPLVLPGLPDDVRRRLVVEHLLDPRRYLSPAGIPSVSMDEPTFNPLGSLQDVARALLGQHRVAARPGDAEARLRRGGRRRLRRARPAPPCATAREYYHPLTGQGLGARGFGWSTLLVDLQTSEE